MTGSSGNGSATDGDQDTPEAMAARYVVRTSVLCNGRHVLTVGYRSNSASQAEAKQ